MPTPVDPVVVLRALVTKHGSQKAVARELGVSTTYICDVLKGRRALGPGPLASLGILRQITYSKR